MGGAWGSATVLSAILLALVASGATCLGASAPPEASVAQQASHLYALHDLASATAILQQGVKQYPDSAQLHFMLGNAYLRSGKWLPAASEYEKSAKLRPIHSDTQLNLGYAYYHAGNRDEAIKAWRKAVALSPRDSLPAVSLALGLYADGHEHEARECMMRAMRMDPGWNRRVELDFRWSPDMRTEIDELAKASGDTRQAASQHS